MRAPHIVSALLLALALPPAARAQDLARVGGDSSIFARLPLPPANEYRTASGAPGHAYWQNRADYDIKARLDTSTKSLFGDLTIRYTNNSPDTLFYVWLQVEQNAFTDSAAGTYVFPQNTRFGFLGFRGGFVLDSVRQMMGSKGMASPHRIEGTMMKVDLLEPLAPGRMATVQLGWHFAIPDHGADRMGRDGSLYELAQWYPRLAVYDDVGGWNTEPYLGQSEFYLEYGDFHFQVTVPAGFIVAGTGTLDNPREVLTAAQIGRLATAAKVDTVVPIVTEAELRSGAARPSQTGTTTWKFTARSVRDVAWATSPEYRWDATSWKGIIANSYYRPSAAATWTDAADQARESIIEYSERWFLYPYPQISVVEGPVSGMEYPMVAMEARGDDKPDLYNVITHEIGHNWFPMIVGSNERLHFWMDEGFNTFINTFAEARRYPMYGDQMGRAADERDAVVGRMRTAADLTVDIPADRINGNELGYANYYKPSVGLELLRSQILGPRAFDDAFRTYIRRWAFKHPTPADFYRTMEDVSGHRLDWFWREWFVDDYRFDQAIDTVFSIPRGDSLQTVVRYENRARGVMPLIVRITLSDGSVEEYRYPVEAWLSDPQSYLRRYTWLGKRPVKIEVDPEEVIPDVNRANNAWTEPPRPPG